MSKALPPLTLFLIFLFLSSACSPLPSPAQTETSTSEAYYCESPGTLENLEIDSIIQSYAYRFTVYLPPCYSDYPEYTYPILYLVPGKTSGPEAWFIAGAEDVADELILSGEIPPFIIAATRNIEIDRNADIIMQEVIPYVESHYRVSPQRRHHAVAGGSLGGIAAYRIVFREPDRFCSAAMFGSGLISGEEEQFQDWISAMTPENKPRMFLITGEGDPIPLGRAKAMLPILDDAGISYNFISGEGDHSYTYWVSNLPTYYHWMAEDW